MRLGESLAKIFDTAKFRLALIALSGLIASPVLSQALLSDGVPTRVPATGIAILDCNPPEPAPEDSCLVRVPPNQLRGALQRKSLGDTEAEFEFVRPQDDLFPKDIDLSATLLLIDRSPTTGQGGRRATWAFEREQILKLTRSLPAEEQVAVYTFDEKLTKLVDFTNNRAMVLDAIASLELAGLNTRISTSTEEAINILDQLRDVLLKNVIVITDGEEEGDGDTARVSDVASKSGVTVSALGMLWSAPGASSAGAAMDYLQELTKGSLGSFRPVRLRLREEAETAVDRFVEDINSSIGASGLIVPKGTPQAAEIIVEMRIPIVGDESNYRSEEVRAKFIPTEAPAPDAPTEAVPDGKLIFGFPALYVYAAIAAGALLLLLLLFLLMRRSGKKNSSTDDQALSDEDLAGLDIDDDGKTEIGMGGRYASAPASAPPMAFLMRADTRDRIPVPGPKSAIGRSKSNGVVLPDSSVSRVHATLQRNRDGSFSITDMDSLNGTFVNDRKISGTEAVKSGDVIGFGTVKASLILAP
jgi:hypothetical protein